MHGISLRRGDHGLSALNADRLKERGRHSDGRDLYLIDDTGGADTDMTPQPRVAAGDMPLPLAMAQRVGLGIGAVMALAAGLVSVPKTAASGVSTRATI